MAMTQQTDHVIIAGYGVGGRFIAESLGKYRIPFVIVELNRQTCETQRSLGVEVIHGDISDRAVLLAAGIERASVLALAISDEAAAVRATAVAHAIRPEIHIIAGTRYTSTGMQALQKGADEVIVAEQAVAQAFCRRISNFINKQGKDTSPRGGI